MVILASPVPSSRSSWSVIWTAPAAVIAVTASPTVHTHVVHRFFLPRLVPARGSHGTTTAEGSLIARRATTVRRTAIVNAHGADTGLRTHETRTLKGQALGVKGVSIIVFMITVQ